MRVATRPVPRLVTRVLALVTRVRYCLLTMTNTTRRTVSTTTIVATLATSDITGEDVATLSVDFTSGNLVCCAIHFSRNGASAGVEIYFGSHLSWGQEFRRYARTGADANHLDRAAIAAVEAALEAFDRADATPHADVAARFAAIELW